MRRSTLLLAALLSAAASLRAAASAVEAVELRAFEPETGAAALTGSVRLDPASFAPLELSIAPIIPAQAPGAAVPDASARQGLPAVSQAMAALDAKLSDGLKAMAEGGLDAAQASGEQVVARLQGDFLISASGEPAAEPSPSEFLVSDANFEVADEPADPSGLMDELRAIKDPAARDRAWLARSKIEKFDIRRVESGARWTPETLDAWARRLPEALKTHFTETLARHEHAATQEDGARTYRVKDGLEFWIDFATPGDPEKRAAAEVFLHGVTRRHLSKDPAYRLVAALTGGPLAVTRIVDAGRLTAGEWSALRRLADDRGLSLARFGRYGLIGSGAGFHLTHAVLLSAQGLSAPALAQRLDRVLTFLARKGIDVGVDENVGAAAFFNPLERRFAYVMPSRAGLNAFSHESTHARFHEFEARLKSWTRARKLAVPYEADGPFVALLADFGGFMNLLNELNSWRTGEAFDGGKSDEAILDILRDSYGRQAGPAAAALFASLWPASRVAGVSVPRLILRAVRALNRLDDAGLRALAGRTDEPSQMNFLRLVRARHPGGAPEDLRGLARGLTADGASEAVRETAKALLEAKAADAVEDPDAARSRERRDYARAAGKWISGFEKDEIKVIPTAMSFGAAAVLRFAAENGLFDYDETIRRMRARWGSDIVASDDERALFASLAAEPGAAWDDKIVSYLLKYNATGFEALWKGFQEKPSYNLRELLVEKHKADLKAEHVRQLARWALETGVEPELQSASAELLGSLLSAHGFDAIYPPAQLASLQEMQRAMNRKDGRALEDFVPVGRAPASGHWLLSALDEGAAAAMFDGKPGTFRLKMIELISQRAFPEELPRLRSRLLGVVTDPKIDRFDQWVARMFLIPSSGQIFQTHYAWGEAVAGAVLADPAPNATALEFVGEFYRLSLGAGFHGPAWGKFNGLLDAARRAEAESAVAKLSPEDAARYRRALDELWRLLGDADEKVRVSALYAIAFRPVFLVGLERRLAAELVDPSSRYRRSAIRLASMAKPGFSPRLDAALSEIEPNAAEKLLLRLRAGPAS